MSERPRASSIPRVDRVPLVEPDVLVLQGASACIFILGMGALLFATQMPIHWQPGQLARLIGLLWAVPVTVIMTYRHALRDGAVDDPVSYLERMRLVRRVALAVLLLAVPWVQWAWQGGMAAPFAGDLGWPMVLSLTLCWGVGRLAEQVVQVWFVLQARDWEDIATLECAGLPRVYPQPGMLDRGYLIGKLWRWWLVGGLALSVLLAAHGFATRPHDALSFGWWAAGFGCYLLFGPLLISRATVVRWRTQWQLEHVRIAPDMSSTWGQVALSVTLLAMLGVGLLLGGFVLAHNAVLWACSLVHVPTFPPKLSAGLPHRAVASMHLSSASIKPMSDSGHGWPLPSALGWVCAIVFVLVGLLGLARLLVGVRRGAEHARARTAPAGVTGSVGMDVFALAAAPLWLVQSVARRCARGVGILWWSRTQRRGAVSRWTVLAALLLELGRYGSWLLAHLRRPAWPEPDGSPNEPVASRRAWAPRPRPIASMQPAEAVVALYHRATDLAGRYGQPRREGQTPHEHAQAVAARHPEAGEHLRQIGDVFVEARFRQAPASAEHVRRLTASWTQLRRTLRRGPEHRER